jgi:phospholipid/cholesterol/gamma-HCH transport system substrate-binding protein
VVPLSRTRRGAEVEEVLAALGLLLNGGGLAQLKTINVELATALENREPAAKDALHQLDAFVGGLDAQKADIVRAIDALDRLGGHLAEQRAVIGKALDALAPGLTVLAEQRQQLTTALKALGELGRVGTRVVNASRDDTLASIRALQPILEQLVKAGTTCPSRWVPADVPVPAQRVRRDRRRLRQPRRHRRPRRDTILSNLLVAAPARRSRRRRRRGPRRHDRRRSPRTPRVGSPTVAPLAARRASRCRCLPVAGLLRPAGCRRSGLQAAAGCVLIPPLGSAPPGSSAARWRRTARHRVPARTLLVPGTILSPSACCPGYRRDERPQGGLTDVLGGGLLP